MKKNIGTFLLCGLFVLAAWILRQDRIYRPPLWIEGTPRILKVGDSGMQAVFKVSEPAVIYWRIYPEGHPAPRFSDFTDTNTVGTAAYGGGLVSAGGAYTNGAEGLEPGTAYVLYAVCAPRSAAFTGTVKALPFHTELTKP